MAQQISKLSPARDLQCYFLLPSAIAAMSNASEQGFTVSGKWRQQFDWAVVEWNRDNVFEHPSIRYLPDGDLSQLVLTYQEERTNCIPVESNLVPIVDWNDLRIWASDSAGVEQLYHVNLAPLATPVAGQYTPASATMTLTASPGTGNRVGLAFLEAHYYYTVGPSDSLSDIAQGIANSIATDPDFTASSNGVSVTVTWQAGPTWGSLKGANCNRIAMYGFAENGVACWAEPTAQFSGGQFPTTYQISINFASLQDSTGNTIPTNRVRKLRWTWAADLQPAEFVQTEFQVSITGWTVSGGDSLYSVAGPGSRRIEDTDSTVSYSGAWDTQMGNYSGSRIHHTSAVGSSCNVTYSETASHDLYLGTRLLSSGGTVNVSVDGQSLSVVSTMLDGEDVLVRSKIGTFAAGQHIVTLTNAGPGNPDFFFDFLEIVYPTNNLPEFVPQPQLSLATDWDTYHSQSLPAERTAWLINTLGFTGRVNHYTGALWFYELTRPGTQYAASVIDFTGQQVATSPTINVWISAAGAMASPAPTLSHLVLPDDTPQTIVQALVGLVNQGTNLLWASGSGPQLTLTARAMGVGGNGITVAITCSSTAISASPASSVLSGGIDAAPYNLDLSLSLNNTFVTAADGWRTDLTATPRINRAARDWHQAYFTALKAYGIDCTAAFSTELQNADPSPAVGIAQCYPDGTPVVLSTPSIQTNFSPASLAFWKQVYLDMAQLQAAAGMNPYLQSGEVQWWYFPNSSGMPFYDASTQQIFQATFGSPMQVIPSNTVDPTQYPNECRFLPSLIGSYTAAIRGALQQQYPGCRYEVLYPTDTNDTPLNQIINFPANDWTALNLTCLKTESFTFTGNYNLDQSIYSMGVSAVKGFPNSARAHLIGISDAWSAWMKESDIAQSEGLESVVLFALDQYCLIGYPAPPFVNLKQMRRQG